MYQVLCDFYDLQDSVKTKGGEVYHSYRAGDIYPRDGYQPPAERIAELSGSDNKRGIPLIQDMTQDSAAAETVEESAPEVPKRRRKKAE